MSIEVRICTRFDEMSGLFPLFTQLNPKLSETRYHESLHQMLTYGYRMVTASDGDQCVGMSGLWTGFKFYSGKYYELDNVVVDAAYRSHGIGSLMITFIEQLAAEEGVDMLMLDVYRENFKGQQFYEREGFITRGFHCLKPLTEWSKGVTSPLPDRFAALDREVRSLPH